MFQAIRKPARGLASSFALAISLAGGAVIGTAAFSTVAQAKSDYSKEFVKVYQPVASMTEGETPDFAGAATQLGSVEAAIKTDDDRNAAGGLFLNVGGKVNDKALQRKGLEMMLASGKTAPEQIGLFNFYVGNLAFEAGDYTAARAALEASLAAGYAENDPRGLIIESFYKSGQTADGIAYTLNAMPQIEAAGGKVPERWLLRGLQAAYEAAQTPQIIDISRALLQNYPTSENWLKSTQVINAVGDFDNQEELDMLRLMRKTKALTQQGEYSRYIENADPRIMSNEVDAVLDEGTAAGLFKAGDTYYKDVKSVVGSRKAQDRADAPTLMRDADKGNGRDALSAGDVLYSLGRFSDAETYYTMAAGKGDVDRNIALTRAGIAQVQQGKYAEAEATLAQVSGKRKPIADMWAIYAATQAN